MRASFFVKVFVVLLLIAAVACIAVVAVCNPPYKDAETPDRSDVKILYLGDSIAEGVAGPSPVIERQNYVYPSIIGEINGFTYVNRAVSGHTTQDMLEYISREEDENAYTHITHIKTANIISVSILGNDLLQTNFNVFVRNAIDGTFDAVDAVLMKSYQNVDKIVKRLKELNPDATLLFQTVYNPVFPESDLMSAASKQYALQKGYEKKDFTAIGGLLINRMNDVLHNYLVEHPGAFTLVDVNQKFDRLVKQDTDRLKRLIFHDGIHPSNEGHAVIASAMQSALEDLGFADHQTAIAGYKKLCVNRLSELYEGTEVDVKGVTKQMNALTEIDKITRAYFDAIEDVKPNYENNHFIGEIGDAKQNAFVNNPEYTIEYAEVWGNVITSVFNKEKSGMTFLQNGTFEWKLCLSDITLAGAGAAIVSGADKDGYIDLSEYMSWLDSYVAGLFPTESMKNLNSLLTKIKVDLGIYLIGVDTNDERVIKLFDKVSAEEKVRAEEIELPGELGLALRGAYEMTSVPSVTQPGGYKAAYLGEHAKNSEPYFILTFYEEDGKEKVLFHNEVLKADVVMSRVKK